MIACPSCGSDTRVTETRVVAPGQARRRRRCMNAECRQMVTSYEFVVATHSKRIGGEMVLISRSVLEQISKLSVQVAFALKTGRDKPDGHRE